MRNRAGVRSQAFPQAGRNDSANSHCRGIESRCTCLWHAKDPRLRERCPNRCAVLSDWRTTPGVARICRPCLCRTGRRALGRDYALCCGWNCSCTADPCTRLDCRSLSLRGLIGSRRNVLHRGISVRGSRRWGGRWSRWSALAHPWCQKGCRLMRHEHFRSGRA
jgi:hypothetical protein